MYLKRELIQPDVSKLCFPEESPQILLSHLSPVGRGEGKWACQSHVAVAPLQEDGREPSGPAEILTPSPGDPAWRQHHQ